MQTFERCYPALFRDGSIIQLRATMVGTPAEGAQRVCLDLYDATFESAFRWSAAQTFDEAVDKLLGISGGRRNMRLNASRLYRQLSPHQTSAFVIIQRSPVEYRLTRRPPSGIHPRDLRPLDRSCDLESLVERAFGIR